MNVRNSNFSSIESMRQQLTQQMPKDSNIKELEKKSISFEEVLSTKQKTKVEDTNGIRFSKHANDRLAYRNIDLSKEQMERLENGTNRAREKGIQESLVMVDDLAFIVNVKNNVVITAVNDTEDAVFTNIDGAVIS
ncbi:MAG: flagellar protein [Clostridiales bacterium]|nr:flagellar protein [Clostridiales bacterium]MDE7422822.1 flagellar protein [Lachnospiraceae bacterium]